MLQNTKYLFLLIISTFILSCKETPTPEPVIYQKSKGVFICNEGNYTYGNASLSFYDPQTNSVENQIFYNTNNFPLGDVCMSMTIKDSVGFLVINNSGKILIINTNTFKHTATITTLTSPRYIQIISDTKAYITDLYNPNITIFNPSTFEITGLIYIGKSTESITMYNNYAFVTSWSYNNKIYKIDTQTDKLIDSLTLTKQPNSIVLDANNKLWVLSDGGFSGIPGGQEIPALTKIDAAGFQIEKIFSFPSIDDSPKNIRLNGTKDTLYFINSSWSQNQNTRYGIFKMPINSVNLPTSPVIAQKENLFYGLGIDPVNSDIYISDAVDYMQKGIVFHYKSDGTKIDSFKTDIIPSYFKFKK